MRSGRQASTHNTFFESKCFFCGKARKFLKSKVRDELITSQTCNIQRNIESNARLLNDTQLLGKISETGDFIAKEVKYH
jgi:hypothetical protein